MIPMPLFVEVDAITLKCQAWMITGPDTVTKHLNAQVLTTSSPPHPNRDKTFALHTCDIADSIICHEKESLEPPAL